MFRLLAPILIVAVSGFGSTGHYDHQHCVDAPAQEVAAYTASLGGGAEVLTSCDAVAADGAACADPEAKIGCCASCSAWASSELRRSRASELKFRSDQNL